MTAALTAAPARSSFCQLPAAVSTQPWLPAPASTARQESAETHLEHASARNTPPTQRLHRQVPTSVFPSPTEQAAMKVLYLVATTTKHRENMTGRINGWKAILNRLTVHTATASPRSVR